MRLRLIINYTEVAAAKSGYWQCGTVLWRFDYPIQKSLSSTIYTKLDELTLKDITQLKSILQRFRSFFPEHKDKKLYGILASVDLSNELREKILQEGFYVARIHDQVFELDIPDNFQPRPY